MTASQNKVNRLTRIHMRQLEDFILQQSKSRKVYHSHQEVADEFHRLTGIIASAGNIKGCCIALKCTLNMSARTNNEGPIHGAVALSVISKMNDRIESVERRLSSLENSFGITNPESPEA